MPDARADPQAEPTSVLRFDAGAANGMAAAACSGPVGSKSVPVTSQPSAKPPLKFPNGFSCVRSWNVRLIERGLGSATPRVDDQNGQLPFRRNIRHPRDLIAYRAFSVPSGTSTCAERRWLILDGPRGQGDGAGLGSANPGRTPASVVALLGRRACLVGLYVLALHCTSMIDDALRRAILCSAPLPGWSAGTSHGSLRCPVTAHPARSSTFRCPSARRASQSSARSAVERRLRPLTSSNRRSR
jgi:hypothetical protein